MKNSKFSQVSTKTVIFEAKNHMTKKEKNFENTHKLHKNSKTYLDVQNEFAPKLRGTTSLTAWKKVISVN